MSLKVLEFKDIFTSCVVLQNIGVGKVNDSQIGRDYDVVNYEFIVLFIYDQLMPAPLYRTANCNAK